MKRIFTILSALSLSLSALSAKEKEVELSDTTSTYEWVKVDMSSIEDNLDKKGRYAPEHQRMDREIDKVKFAYKDEWMLGLTATYASLTTDNAELLLLLENLSVDGGYFTLKPYVGYFYRDNHCAGIKFGYTNLSGSIDSGEIDLGSTNDVVMDIPYFGYDSEQYSYSIFHRSYAGLDRNGHFGLFAEIEASYTMGDSTFEYENGGVINSTYSEDTRLSLSFNPGLAVYAMNNICATVSFEFGGLNYTSIKQYDESGAMVGERHASKMSFKANLLAINIGFTYHLWR